MKPASSNADTITDFTNGLGGDVLKFGNILTNYNGNISEYVQVTQDINGNSLVAVDVNGLLNGSKFILVATLTGVNIGTDEAALLANGNISITT